MTTLAWRGLEAAKNCEGMSFCVCKAQCMLGNATDRTAIIYESTYYLDIALSSVSNAQGKWCLQTRVGVLQ